MNDEKSNFIERCNRFGTAMLVTKGTDGMLSSRPMMIAQFESDGDLWFATDKNSLKVDEILRYPEICITLADGRDFVSISGQATVVDDKDKIEELWSEPWRVWFPGGKADPSLTLIRVDAKVGEFWSSSGTNRFNYLFAAAKAYVSGERPVLDDSTHARLEL